MAVFANNYRFYGEGAQLKDYPPSQIDVTFAFNYFIIITYMDGDYAECSLLFIIRYSSKNKRIIIIICIYIAYNIGDLPPQMRRAGIHIIIFHPTHGIVMFLLITSKCW